MHGVAWLFPEFQFLWLAEETKKNLPLELDFVHEAKNCERVAKMFSHFSFLKVCSEAHVASPSSINVHVMCIP